METKWEETTKDEERKRIRDERRNVLEVGWNVAYVDDWSGDVWGHQRRTMMKKARVNPMLIRKRAAMIIHQVIKKKKMVMMMMMMMMIVQTRKEI
jgi:hypothetical protein